MSQDNAPSPLTLMKNVEANLQILHLHPEQVRPIRLSEIAAYRDLLIRSSQRIADLLADIQGGSHE